MSILFLTTLLAACGLFGGDEAPTAPDEAPAADPADGVGSAEDIEMKLEVAPRPTEEQKNAGIQEAPPPKIAPEREAELIESAVSMAEPFLATLDSGDYEKSHTELITSFQHIVTPDQWRQTIESMRKKLGKLEERVAEEVKAGLGAPQDRDAEWVMITYSSTFEGDLKRKETIVLMNEHDQGFKPSTYYVR